MTDLIVVEKAGERISVHPATLDEHQRVGWAVSADQVDTSVVAIAATTQTNVDETLLKVGKGPGGKFYVRQGKVNLKGPFSTEEEAAMVTPDGEPTPIPEAWEAMTDDELLNLAAVLSGGPVAASGDETPVTRAKSIIQASVDDRASHS